MKRTEGAADEKLRAGALSRDQAGNNDLFLYLPRVVTVVLLLLMCPTRAQAQRNTKGFLLISGQFDSISVGRDGGGGRVEWFHPLSEKSAVSLGVSSFFLGESRWSYAKIAGYSKYSDRTIIYGELDLGPGRQKDEKFLFQIYKAGLTRALMDKRLYAEAEEQFIQVGTTTQNTVKAGMIVYPSPSLSCRLNYHFSIGGNTHSRLVAGRFDVEKRIHYLGGFTLGDASPVQFDLVGSTNGTTPSKQFYGGLGVPIGNYELIGVVDTLQLLTVRKCTLSLTWKIPL